MTRIRLAAATAVASLAGVAVLGLGAPAMAQEYPPASGAGATVTDSTPVPGQSITVTTAQGAFDANSDVSVSIDEFGISGTVKAAADGSASFTFEVPEDARPGRVDVDFGGVLDGAATSEEVSFTVVAAAAASPGRGQAEDRRSALPFTGSNELVPLTITGLVLVGAGAGLAVAARRRTASDLPSDLA